MATTTITFTDADEVEYKLRVSFDFQPEQKPSGPSYASGGEPGYPAHLESTSARCLSLTTASGKFTVLSVSEQKAGGEKLLADHREEIEALVMDAYAAEDEWRRESAAEARRERMIGGGFA